MKSEYFCLDYCLYMHRVILKLKHFTIPLTVKVTINYTKGCWHSKFIVLIFRKPTLIFISNKLQCNSTWTKYIIRRGINFLNLFKISFSPTWPGYEARCLQTIRTLLQSSEFRVQFGVKSPESRYCTIEIAPPIPLISHVNSCRVYHLCFPWSLF